MATKLIPQEVIETRIFIIRGQKVMLDRDLATLYGVETKYLNRQVRRNKERFPEEFMFQLTRAEKNKLVTICHRFEKLKHSNTAPQVFTEFGIAMLSSVLRSELAVKINIEIIKTFIKLRETLSTHKELLKQIHGLEQKVSVHDEEIQAIFEAIRKLMEPPLEKPKKQIGFHV